MILQISKFLKLRSIESLILLKLNVQFSKCFWTPLWSTCNKTFQVLKFEVTGIDLLLCTVFTLKIVRWMRDTYRLLDLELPPLLPDTTDFAWAVADAICLLTPFVTPLVVVPLHPRLKPLVCIEHAASKQDIINVMSWVYCTFFIHMIICNCHWLYY